MDFFNPQKDQEQRYRPHNNNVGELKRLSVDFTQSAGRLQDEAQRQQRVAAALSLAAANLAERDEKILKLEREIAKLKHDAAMRDFKGPLVLIDGSGSMTGGNFTAIPDALAYAKKADGIAMLAGDKHPVLVDVHNEAHVKAAVHGLNCGTDLAPSLREAAKALKNKHVVLVSDGDLFDTKATLAALGDLLAQQPKTKIDVVLTRSTSSKAVTGIELMLKQFEAPAGAKAPRLIDVPRGESIAAALDKLLLKTAQKAKAQKQQGPKM